MLLVDLWTFIRNKTTSKTISHLKNPKTEDLSVKRIEHMLNSWNTFGSDI